MDEEKYDNDFYEDAGDLLVDFRKHNSGGFIEKDGKDPFAKDSDVIQSEREDKLRDSERQGNFHRDKE
jgi:hypothetical protein